MACPRCQHENPPDHKFCSECGTLLQRATGSVQPALSYADQQRALNEALARESATVEVLRAISRAQTDVQPVFDVIASSALRLCDGVASFVFRHDGTLVHLAAFDSVEGVNLQPLRHIFPAPPESVTFAGRVVTTARLLYIADIEHDRDAPPTLVEFARANGFRSIYAAPMLRDGHTIGVIAVTHRDVDGFTPKQGTLLETFADQAVIAIENVRLFNETKEALEQQIATSEILRVISSSPTDVQPVFDAMLERAVRLCDVPYGALFRLQNNQLHLVGLKGGISANGLGTLASIFPRSIDEAGLLGRAVSERQPVQTADLFLDPRVGPRAVEAARIFGYRSFLHIPLLRDGNPIGVLTVGKRETGNFPDSQIALLQTFADQAVIAIENVRLFKELEARNRDLTQTLDQQTATSEILRVISSSPTDVRPVFDAIADSALRLLRGWGALVVRFDGHLLHAAAIRGGSPGSDDALRQRFPMPARRGEFAGEVILDRAVKQIADVETDQVPAGLRANARVRGWRANLGVPMLHDGQPIGVLTVTRAEPGAFSPQEVELLKTFADQAVIAIENVRLFTQLQEKNRDLTTALDQQTATSDILRVISGSQREVQPVFDTIVQSAARLCNAAITAVFRTDGLTVYNPANYGDAPEALAAVRSRYPRPVDMGTMPGIAILTRSVVHFPDVEESTIPEHVRQVGRLLGFRSVVAVPMLREGEAVGALLVARDAPGWFSDAEVELLKTFSDQAVIAIENVRLFKELEARTEELSRSVNQLTALGEVGRAVSSSLDLETVLTTIVSRAVELSGLDGGVMFEYEEVAEEFVQRAQTETGGTLAEARRTNRIRKGEGVLGLTAITLESVQVPDITVPGAYTGRLRENLIESGIRAILAVPMVYEGRLIGCLGVTRNHPGDFPSDTIELLRTFATQSALAIQNARLFREIADKSRQLEVASQHKSEFLANMSHELRTPLNAIIGFSEVLTDRMFGDLNEKQEEYLKDIYASGTHLLSLINDILDLSKIEAGRMELDLTDFHLPTALDNALTLVRERAGRRSITLQMSVDERLGEVRADERKIRQVVLNLLSNAIKFTPEGGRIEVAAVPRDGFAEVSVRDTGVGIAPEDQEAVFEEFRQVGAAEKKAEGTGLGLTLCRKFIELHGGRIWLRSQVGVGSTFTFTIPIRRGE